MKYYSELTKKIYDTEEELNAAEELVRKEREAAEAKRKAEEEKRLALKAQRAERAKEIEDLIKQRTDLQKQINTKINDFVKDYGAYHYSYKDSFVDGIWKTLFNFD